MIIVTTVQYNNMTVSHTQDVKDSDFEAYIEAIANDEATIGEVMGELIIDHTDTLTDCFVDIVDHFIGGKK